MRKRKKYVMTPVSAEQDEMIRIDPVAAGERYLTQLEKNAEIALNAVNAGGEGMVRAVRTFRLYQAFGHDLAQASGRARYEVRQAFHTRLGSDYLRRQFMAFKHGGSLPTVEQSEVAQRIIEAVKSITAPKSPVVLDAVDDYPQPRQESRPSLDE